MFYLNLIPFDVLREEVASPSDEFSGFIENFWGFAKTKLKRYYGVSRKHYYSFLKEMKIQGCLQGIF